MTIRDRRKLGLAFLVIWAAVCWPLTWWLPHRWFIAQVGPVSGLVFLAGLGIWLWLTVQAGDSDGATGPHPGWLLAGALCLGFYTGLYRFSPHSISAQAALAGLGCWLVSLLPARLRHGVWGLPVLLLLAAIMEPHLNFAIGFPLRQLSAKLVAASFHEQVVAVGTGLSDGVHLVYVDAPCSGTRMLWTGLVLAAGASVVLSLSWWRTVVVLLISVIVALIGNAWRAGSLFLLETRMAFLGVSHTLVGLVVFIICVAIVLACAIFLARRQTLPQRSASENVGRYRLAVSICALTGIVACAVPFFGTIDSLNETPNLQVAWPETWNNEALGRLDLRGTPEAQLGDFEGEIAQFRLAEHSTQILLRVTDKPTRRIHPVENCYRASGWQVAPLPPLQDQQGRLWSVFQATHPDGRSRRVRQLYAAIEQTHAGGDLATWLQGARTWPDASAWYWAAARPGGGVRRTLAIAVADQPSAIPPF